MRLLYLITRSEPGGAQVHVLELLRGYRNQAKLFLGVGEEGFLAEEARALGIKVKILPHLVQPLSPYEDLKGLLEITHFIKHVQPNLIHLHSSKAGLLGRLAGRLLRYPTLFTAHGWAFTEGVSWKRKLAALPAEALAARIGGYIITVSRYDFELALRYRVAPAHRMTVVHNGLPDVLYMAKPGEGIAPRIVMVARFAVQKDHALLLQALSRLRDDPWELELVGDGPLIEPTQRLVKKLGLESRVRFLGSRPDVPEILARAHVFALVSNYEGFPLSILEAMRAGLPVVASDVGGVGEAVVDGETGFLVPRGDLGALRDRLRRLIRDPTLRAQMGAEGRKRYKQYFTVDRMLEKTLKVYEKVLAQASKRTGARL